MRFFSRSIIVAFLGKAVDHRAKCTNSILDKKGYMKYNIMYEIYAGFEKIQSNFLCGYGNLPVFRLSAFQ